MSVPIELGAIVERGGRVWVVCAEDAGEWTLPGGLLLAEHEDVEVGMAAWLSEHGLGHDALADAFVETLYIPAAGGHRVYNLYQPRGWVGEPAPPAGARDGWFAPADLEQLEMEPVVRDAILRVFGLRDAVDHDAIVMGALSHYLRGQQPASEPPLDRRAAAMDVMETLSGGRGERQWAWLEANLRELAGDSLDLFANTWANPGLDRRTRSLVVVAMLAAAGRLGPLKAHVHGALNHGARPAEIVETLRMVAGYAGFPAALEAWPVMEGVFADRGIPRPGALS